MNYLFFDIECCNGRDICEFGYVLADGDLNVTEKDIITVNPGNRRFLLTNRKGTRGIHLYYDESVYRESPKFPSVFRRIREVIRRPDQMIIGHSVKNDAYFIMQACDRYYLNQVEFEFFDTQRMFSELFNERNGVSLESAGERLGLDKPEIMHRSDEDSLYTLKVVRAMCEKFNKPPDELIRSCETARGYSRDEAIGFYSDGINETLKRMEIYPDAFGGGQKERCLHRFAESVLPRGEIIASPIKGKRVCFSEALERERTRDVAVFIQYIADRGGRYTAAASGCDYLITEGNSARSAATGRRTKKITPAAFMEIIGVTQEQLDAEPVPQLPKRRAERIRYEADAVQFGPKLKTPKERKPQGKGK